MPKQLFVSSFNMISRVLFQALSVYCLLVCTTACVSKSNYQPSPPAPEQPIELIEHALTSSAAEECQVNSDDEREQLVFDRLALAVDWHAEGRYSSAMEAYEAVLADDFSIKSNAYALWGIISLRLDRNNSDYSRESANLVFNILQQRLLDYHQRHAVSGVQIKPGVNPHAELQLLVHSARALIDADVGKDGVYKKNKALREELTQKDEAIKRLRELTVDS